ncbi:hypothetical protein XPA_010046 [Xanthoria parietina]
MDLERILEPRSPTEECWSTVRGIRMNGSLQAEINSEEKMPGSEAESRGPAEDCFGTIRGIRMNESLQADINSEEKMPGSEAVMPGSEAVMPGSEATMPGTTSAPGFPRPPPSPLFPSKVPLLGPEPPEPPRGRTSVQWSYFLTPPELHPAPPYHLWHPTTVIFEYLHVRGHLNSGGFDAEGEFYPVVPERLLHLCRWFNNTTQEVAKREKLVWSDHLQRVKRLKKYWDEGEKRREKRFLARDDLMMEIIRAKVLEQGGGIDEEADYEMALTIMAGFDKPDGNKDEDEEEESELEIIMDLDLSDEGEKKEVHERHSHVGDENQREQTGSNVRSHEASQGQETPVNGEGGENGFHRANGNQNGYSNGTQNGHHNAQPNGNHTGHPRLKRKTSDEDDSDGSDTVTVNPAGEEDPNGLTPRDWRLTARLEQTLEIGEGASTAEVVRETVLWAVDIHDIGEMWKGQRADEGKDDVPTHRRIGDVRRIRSQASLDSAKENLGPSFTAYRDVRDDSSSSSESMATVKRPPPSQQSHQNSKDHPPKRILRGFPPAPPTSLPPAVPRHPSQWAANLNINITDLQPPPKTIPPPQPTKQHNPTCHPHASSTSPPPKNLQHPPSPLRTRAPPPSKPQHTPTTARLLHRFAEPPMPLNATDMTMAKCLDRILIPRYLAANPRCPDAGAGARCRERYKCLMRFRHMKLVSRVERWRLYLPTQNQTQENEEEDENEKDAELEHERQIHKTRFRYRMARGP